MKIATWNINNVNKRLPLLLAWLEAARPDVVALQELKSTDAEFPRAAIEAAGYGCMVSGQKSGTGVALLARVPSQCQCVVGWQAMCRMRRRGTSRPPSVA